MKNKLIGRAVRLSGIAENEFSELHQNNLKAKFPCNVYETDIFEGKLLLSFSENDNAHVIHPCWLEVEPIEEKEVDSENDINHFVEFLKDNYSIEIPDMAVQEYLKYEKKTV